VSFADAMYARRAAASNHNPAEATKKENANLAD
jgi:hypothetical protein